MANAAFIAQLKDLGYVVTEDGDRVRFAYEIPVGRFAGTTITLGFAVPGDFPLSPPTGPHLSPRLLPINPAQGPHPTHGIQESPNFGADWEYWSRPIPEWQQLEKSVRTVMAHIRRLFATQ